MRGGHNRKSANLKILEGRSTGRVDNSPKTPPIFPHRPPRGTPKHAREFWKEYAPMLDRAGMLRASDVPAWEVLCLTFNTIKLSEEAIAEHGLLVPGARGQEMVKNPVISVLNQARQQFRLQCQEFGLTPHSRERLGADMAQGEQDPMEALLSGLE